MGRLGSALLFASLICAATGVPSRAGENDSSNSDVYARLRPEYDPGGMRVGAFTLFPSMSTGGGANSNVFNAETGTQDFFYALNAGAKLESAWSRHKFSFEGQSKSVWYSNQVSENRNDWRVNADLRLDVMRGTSFLFDGVYELQHEARGLEHAGGAFEATDPASPTVFRRNAFAGELGHTLNRLTLTFGGGWESLDYDDSETVGSLVTPPEVINNDDRDRSVLSYQGKAALQVWGDTSVFVRGTLLSTDYVEELDDAGVNRDSDELVLDGGFDLEISHVLVGEIAAGLSQKSFDDASLEEVSGATANIKLKWYPSMLTNVTLDGGRSNQETSITGSSAVISTRGAVSIDHELLRNLILSGQVGYENAEYADTLRNDDTLRGSFSTRYLINKNLHLDAGWEFVDRSSTEQPFTYSGSQFQLSLTGKM